MLDERKRLKNHPIMVRTEVRMEEWRKEHPLRELGESIAKYQEIYNEERLRYINEALG